MPEPKITRDVLPLEEIARILARWWADILRRDHYPSLLADAGYATDGPESAQRGLLGDAMIGLIRQRQAPLTPEQCQAFEDALTDVLLSGFEWEWQGAKHHQNGLRDFAANSPGGAVHLGVDYDPCVGLGEACHRAGIDPAYRFPFKTYSWACLTAVQVSCGYGAGHKFLWATRREWARDQATRHFSEAHPYPEPARDEDYSTPSYRLRVDQRTAAQTTIGDRAATVDDDQPVEAMIAELLRLAEAALTGHA